MSDGEIRQLFRIIDEDDSGDISIDEVTHLIWGDNAGLVSDSRPNGFFRFINATIQLGSWRGEGTHVW
jgi:Ca2+-binding EF-hand superfamily protein